MKKKRRDIGNEETERLLAELEKEVYEQYAIAKQELKAKLNDFNNKFVEDFGKNLAKKEKGEWTDAKFNAWFKTQMDYTHWAEDMISVISKDMTNYNQIAMSIVNGYMPEVYAINMNYSTFDIEKQSKINTSFTLYNAQTVERLIKDNPYLLPKATVNVPKDLRWNKKVLNSAIIQGTLQGEGIDEIAARLMKVTDMNQNVAIRNARTMVTAAQSMGRDDAIKRGKDLGIDVQRVWMARLDFKTRHSHRQLDGEVRDVGEEFSNGLMFPGDPDGAPAEIYNCRCRELPVVYGINPLIEGQRINKLGSMSYEDWKAGKSPVVLAKPKKKPNAPKPKAKPTATAKAPQQPVKQAEPKKDFEITQQHIDRLELYRFKTAQEADDALRPTAARVWKEATKEERKAGYDYTSGSDGYNFPLRGMKRGEYVGVEEAFAYFNTRKRVDALISLIDKSELPNVVLRRGNSIRGSARFMQIPIERLQDRDKLLETELVGRTIEELGFFSCGTVSGKGFTNDVNFNIFCPEGTKGIYAEPFSAFGNGNGLSWDGESGQSSFSSEMETLLQRGTKFKILRVDVTTHSYIDIDIEVIGQG